MPDVTTGNVIERVVPIEDGAIKFTVCTDSPEEVWVDLLTPEGGQKGRLDHAHFIALGTTIEQLACDLAELRSRAAGDPDVADPHKPMPPSRGTVRFAHPKKKDDPQPTPGGVP